MLNKESMLYTPRVACLLLLAVVVLGHLALADHVRPRPAVVQVMAGVAAAGVAQGLRLTDAVTRARDYVHEAIRLAPGLGTGHGPLNHAHRFESELMKVLS